MKCIQVKADGTTCGRESERSVCSECSGSRCECGKPAFGNCVKCKKQLCMTCVCAHGLSNPDHQARGDAPKGSACVTITDKCGELNIVGSESTIHITNLHRAQAIIRTTVGGRRITIEVEAK